jgi:hypothetical protein
MEAEKIYDRQYGMAQLVFFSFASAVGFYAVLIHLVLGEGRAAAAPNPVFRGILYGLSGLCAAGVWIAPKIFLKKVLPADLPKLGQAVLTLQVFVTALAETPAIFGLVLAFESGQKAEFYRLAAWSLVLMVFAYPKKSFWQQVASCARTLK